jgi:hypothetical protein
LPGALYCSRTATGRKIYPSASSIMSARPSSMPGRT